MEDDSSPLELIGDVYLMIEYALVYSNQLRKPDSVELAISIDLENMIKVFDELDAIFRWFQNELIKILQFHKELGWEVVDWAWLLDCNNKCIESH